MSKEKENAVLKRKRGETAMSEKESFQESLFSGIRKLIGNNDKALRPSIFVLKAGGAR